MDVWGWASWRRVWKFYDVEIANNRTDDVLKAIEESNLSAYNKKVHRRFVKEVRNGLSTWDVQFSLLFMVKKMLSIVPRERLIANVGLASPQATHTGGYVYWNKRWSQTGRVVFPLCHPDAVVCDDNADKLHDRIFGAFFPRALTWLGCKVPILRDFLDSFGKRVESFLPILFRL